MNKVKYFVSIIFLSCIAIQSLTAQTAAEITAKFSDYSLLTDTLNIKARLFTPESYDPEDSYPVVMTLHGLGESGDDNEKQVLLNHIATSWGKDDVQAVNPCFIFSPQCPTSHTDWSYTDNYQSVMILLDSLIDTYSIDTTRIYITGLSMGGIGSWYYMYMDPDKYAAAIPVCGGIYGNDEENKYLIETIKHIPVWDFHGGSDNVVPR